MFFRYFVLNKGEVSLCRRVLDGSAFLRPGQGRLLESVSGFLDG